MNESIEILKSGLAVPYGTKLVDRRNLIAAQVKNKATVKPTTLEAMNTTLEEEIGSPLPEELIEHTMMRHLRPSLIIYPNSLPFTWLFSLLQTTRDFHMAQVVVELQRTNNHGHWVGLNQPTLDGIIPTKLQITYTDIQLRRIMSVLYIGGLYGLSDKSETIPTKAGQYNAYRYGPDVPWVFSNIMISTPINESPLRPLAPYDPETDYSSNHPLVTEAMLSKTANHSRSFIINNSEPRPGSGGERQFKTFSSTPKLLDDEQFNHSINQKTFVITGPEQYQLTLPSVLNSAKT